MTLPILPAAPLPADAPLERIAFGSCCKQGRPQHIWPVIAAWNPQLFLFLGDNIYGDTDDMALLRRKYADLLAEPGYRRLRETCPVLAVWDDHDYGLNDGGAEFPPKAESQRIFLETFGVPKDRPAWSRPGIHDAHVFGPEGKRVQIILLDTRYFRSPLVKGGGDWPKHLGPYGEASDPSATMLGDEQWTWLEAQLRLPAELRLICSSIQVLPVDHHWERWQNLPRERARLLSLAASAPGTAPVVFLSGDRHLAELMVLESSSGRALHEATSSGLSHAGGGQDAEPNRFRRGEPFRALNFGSLRIRWAGPTPGVNVAIHDDQGREVREMAVPLQ
jgi:alkaline phosphatase D